MVGSKASSVGYSATPVQFMQMLTSVLTSLETLKHPTLANVSQCQEPQRSEVEAGLRSTGSPNRAVQAEPRFSGARAMLPNGKQRPGLPKYPSPRPTSLLGSVSNRSADGFDVTALRSSISDNGSQVHL